MRQVRISILADISFSHTETTETKQFFLQDGIFHGRNLIHEQLLSVGRIAWILSTVLDGSHLVVELLTCDFQSFAKIERVQILHLTHGHHEVVSRLVEHQQLSVTVVDITSRRVNDIIVESVVVGTRLVVGAEQLKESKTYDVGNDNDECNAANHIFSIIKYATVAHHHL